MAKRLFLTEAYVAQCAHGGKVVPKGTSSTPGVVCAGVPIVNIQDLPGTPIKGCPKKSPCTKVANFTSSSAEMNNKSAGVNLALDLVGIKSNKGAAISLSYNGQSIAGAQPLHTHKSEVKEEEASLIVKKQKELKKQKEKYKLYLIRQSKDNFLETIYKPLRATRRFQKMEEYFSFDITTPNTQIRDKIFTKILSYIYVKHLSGKIDEYKIVSQGSIAAQSLKEIRYKDEENYEHKYIPLYDEKIVELYYSNVKLSKKQEKRTNQLLNFEKITLNPKKLMKNDFYIKEVESINVNEISQEMLKEQKKYDPLKQNANYPFNIIVNINDPLGQIEDLYDNFEFKFKNNYSYNNYHMQNIKKLNAYVYTVANQMDYLYVPQEEQEIYDKNLKKLKTLYEKLVKQIVNGSLSSLIIENQDKIKALDEIINPNYDLAINYFNEVININKTFFKDLNLEKVNKSYFEIKTNDLETRYYGLVDNTHIFEQNQIRKKRLQQEKKSLDKFVSLNANLDYLYLHLDKVNDKKYIPYRQKPQEILALLVFSICFSNEYKTQIKKAKLEQTVQEFYFALKNSPKLPKISNESIEEIRQIIKEQKNSYKKILHKENKLLEQYESLDALNKKYSYDIKEAKQSPQEKLNDLYIPKEYKSFVYEEDKITAKKVYETLQKAIKQKELKKQIEATLAIKEFDTKQDEIDYFNIMINLAYFFIANRTKTDQEANINSPFTKDKLHIYELIENITKRRLSLEENLARQIDELPVIKYYTKTMISHLTHSLLENDNNKIGFSLRSKKVYELFASLKTNKQNQILKTDITNLLDSNYEAELKSKTKIEELNSSILTAVGINSKFVDILEEGKKLVDELDDIGTKPDEYTKNNIQLAKHYKKYLLLSKSAAQFITVMNLSSFAFSKKALKNEDIFPLIESTGKLIGFMGDLMPKTKANIIEQSQKILSVENLRNINNFNTLAKVGMAAIVVSTYYEIQKVEDTNLDAKVAIIMKNSLELSLLIIPLCVTTPIVGFAAAVIVFAIDIAWRFYLKDVFLDSAIETYALKSLLYNHKDKVSSFEFLKVINPAGYTLYSSIYSFFDEKTAYNTLLLKEVMNKKENIIPGFETYKHLQNFIAQNYDKYEQEFEEALKYELTNLKIALNDYKIQKEETVVNNLEHNPYSLYLKTQIKIPKETLQNNIEVILKTNNYLRTINKSEILKYKHLPKMPEDFTYDTVVNSNLRAFLNHKINKRHFEDVYIYIINRDICLKYKISYEVKYTKDDISYYTGMQKERISVQISDINLSPLIKEDETIINASIQRRKFEEEE